MKMYTVVVDGFVTIHPSKGFNVIAADEYDAIEQAEKLFEDKKDEEDAEVRALLDDVCYKIMKIAVEEELNRYEC